VSAVWRERQREGGSALDRPAELLVDQHLETVAVAGTVDARDDQAFGRGLAGYLERACTRREGSLETERVLGNVVTRAPAVHQVAGEGAVLVAVLGRGDEIVLARLVVEAGTERQLATREAAGKRAAQRRDRAFAEFVAFDAGGARGAESGQRRAGAEHAQLQPGEARAAAVGGGCASPQGQRERPLAHHVPLDRRADRVANAVALVVAVVEGAHQAQVGEAVRHDPAALRIAALVVAETDRARRAGYRQEVGRAWGGARTVALDPPQAEVE